MKKIFISTLILLSSLTTQVQAIFIRGAIYKNEKTNQLIVLLGDQHLDDKLAKRQRSQLIAELKNFTKETTLTLVEDALSEKIYEDNEKYQSAIKFRFKFHSRDSETIPYLHSDLLKENMNVENIECRYFEITSSGELPFLIVFHHHDNPTLTWSPEIDKPELLRTPSLTLKDILTEIEQNIQILKKQNDEILNYQNSHPIEKYTTILNYFKKISDEAPNSLREYMNFLKETKTQLCDITKMSPTELKYKLEPLIQIQLKNLHNNFHFVDAKIIYNILKNSDKKIIVVCAGLLHTSVTEKLLEGLGYKCVDSLGVDMISNCNDMTELSVKAKSFITNFTSIDIHELFTALFFSCLGFTKIGNNSICQSVLTYAIENNLPEIVELLINLPNIDINLVNFGTPLYNAVRKNSIKIIELLIRHPKINANLGDTFGHTPLNFSIENKQPEIVKLLIKHPEINVNLANKYGGAPLHLAIANLATGDMQPEIVELLINHPNIDINLKDEIYGTPLILAVQLMDKICEKPTNLAVQKKLVKIIELLIKHPKIIVNLKDGYIEDLLHYAIQNELPEIVESIINHPSIDINLVKKDYCTPLCRFVQKNSIKIIKLLMKHPKINVNLGDEFGSTPLHYAILDERTEIVELLINHPNIDIYAKDACGRTAKYLSKLGGLKKIEKLFEEHEKKIKAAKEEAKQFTDEVIKNVVTKNVKKAQEEVKPERISLYKKKTKNKLKENNIQVIGTAYQHRITNFDN